MGQDGCAVCRLVAKAGRSYLGNLLRELANDPEAAREEFRGSLGPCARRGRLMLEMGDGPEVAILWQTAVRELQKILSRLPERRRPYPSKNPLFRRSPHKPAAAFPEPGAGCAGCRVEDEAEKRYLKALLDGADHGSLHGLLGGPGAVCGRHLSRASALAGGWIPPALVESAEEALRELNADLGQYIRHDANRSADGPGGKERDARRRAVNRMAGPPWS